MSLGKKFFWIGTYGIIAVFFLAVHYALQLDFFDQWPEYQPLISKLTLSLFLVFVLLLLGKAAERFITRWEEKEGARYNLVRIIRLLTVACIIIVIASFLFQNLYAAAVSFGLISLILGFALQAPISSFIAWLYIIFRRPYKVGDRIQLNGIRGDVIEIGYLDTILLECSGDYLENDRLSGRRVLFPNSIILKSEVFNYSGNYVPFIWNETAVQIAYTSDLQFVENCFLKAAQLDFEERYPDYQKQPSSLWEPTVYFRVNAFAWLEAVVSYPVEPTDTTGRRNRILRRALPLMNDHPDKVGFPDGNKR